MYKTLILSSHPTHNIISKILPKQTFPSLLRLGSKTLVDKKYIECNSLNSIKNTSNKLLMKCILLKNNINTPELYVCYLNRLRLDGTIEFINIVDLKNTTEGKRIIGEKTNIMELNYPIIAKMHFKSKNNKVVILENSNQVEEFVKTNNVRKYIFERYRNFRREYKVYATQNGIFCIQRKKRNYNSKSIWNTNFKESTLTTIFNGEWLSDNEIIPCFNEMNIHCLQALKAFDMDICSFDIKVKNDGDVFTIINANSGDAISEEVIPLYAKQVKEVLIKKYEKTQSAISGGPGILSYMKEYYIHAVPTITDTFI